MKGKTLRDVTREWVNAFNAIPQGMIAKLMEYDYEDWREVTTLSIGERVYVYDEHDSGEIIDIINNNGTIGYRILVDNGFEFTFDKSEFEVDRDDYNLPMWGTMWSFGDSADDYWLEELDGIRIMSELGFRVYESQEFGYFFGIDGAGYSFFDEHWMPLYIRRGLQWHDAETLTEDEKKLIAAHTTK